MVRPSADKVILYLPYVKPSRYLKGKNQYKLSAGVTYKTTKICHLCQNSESNLKALFNHLFRPGRWNR